VIAVVFQFEVKPGREGEFERFHGADGEWPMTKEGRRSADEFYELLGRLPEVNEMMPPFPGNDAERRAVAEHLATLTASNPAPKAEGSR
jgi:hypothetical protein